MSGKANTTVIGAFVAGAIVLAVVGILLFGGGKFFKETKKFVLFFEGSIQGLNKGASVAFKGVRVGSVIEVKVLLDSRDLSLQIPVVIEIEPDRMTEMHGLSLDSISAQMKGRSIIEYLVEKGLRAQLDMQSLVTGQLFVNLDFFPHKPARFVNIDTGLTEIPTVPSSLEVFSKTVEKLPISELMGKAYKALKGIEHWVNSPEMADIIGSLRNTMNHLDGTSQQVNEQAKPILSNVDKVLGEAYGLLRDVRVNINPVVADIREVAKGTKELIHNVDNRSATLASALEGVLRISESAVKKADVTLGSLEGMVGEESGIRHELYTTLKELSAAARSIRILADYLERHPEALLHGKGEYGGRMR